MEGVVGGGKLFTTSQGEPGGRVEEKDCCLDVWIQAPLAFGDVWLQEGGSQFPRNGSKAGGRAGVSHGS